MKDNEEKRAQGNPDDTRHWRIKEWFPNLSEEQHDQLRKFYLELVSFNGRMNYFNDLSVMHKIYLKDVHVLRLMHTD